MSNTEVDVTIKEEVADGSPTGVEEKSEEDTREEPFDPTQISIDVKLITLDSIIRRYMDAFMSNAMRVINLMPDIKNEELKKIFKDSDKDPYVPSLRYIDVDSLKKRFFIGMKRANELFGKLAFRRHSKSGRMNPLNKTLFEAWGNVLADIR